MQRRKFLATVGSLTAASAAAMGTGAFTSVNAERSVSVDIVGDESAFLGLVPGDSGLVTSTEDDTLEINLDGTAEGADGSGVNFNAVTTIGDHDNPADNYAFKVVHQGTQDLMFKMNYFLNNPGWINKYSGEGVGIDQSFIQFTVYGEGGQYGNSYPDQSHANQDYSVGQPTGSSFGDNTGDYKFNPGEEYYLVMDVDTTGDRADPDDDLSGTAAIEPAVSTSQDSWDPRSPPN